MASDQSTQTIKFADIKVDDTKQFRQSGTGQADPMIINDLETSIKEEGLRNKISVEFDDNEEPVLVDGFHRHAAWSRLYKAEINSPKSKWREIEVNVVKFDGRSARSTYQYKQNQHMQNICTPNTPGDIAQYLYHEAMDKKGIFGEIDRTNQDSIDDLNKQMEEWLKHELKGSNAKSRRKDVLNRTLKLLDCQATEQLRTYDKDTAFKAMQAQVPSWDGKASLEFSSDKKILCGTITGADKSAKPISIIKSLINQMGTGPWDMSCIPTVKLFGYANVPGDKQLDSVRIQMQNEVKKVNAYFKSHHRKANLIELWVLPQKINRGPVNTESEPRKLL